MTLVIHRDQIDATYHISGDQVRSAITTDTPGMNPASNNPNKNRHATRPPKLFVTPWHIVTIPKISTNQIESQLDEWLFIPHKHIIPLNHHDGGTFLKTRLLGTSKRIYGMKKIKSAML